MTVPPASWQEPPERPQGPPYGTAPRPTSRARSTCAAGAISSAPKETAAGHWRRAANTHWISLTIDPRDPQAFGRRQQIVPGNVNDRYRRPIGARHARLHRSRGNTIAPRRTSPNPRVVRGSRSVAGGQPSEIHRPTRRPAASQDPRGQERPHPASGIVASRVNCDDRGAIPSLRDFGPGCRAAHPRRWTRAPSRDPRPALDLLGALGDPDDRSPRGWP
jgi:hypothetical protein